jgi:hypothetical protein
MKERTMVARSIADPATRGTLKQVAKPNSLSRTLRKAGVALVLSPDPVTGIPGVMILGASLVARRKEPIGASSILAEARRLMDEIGRSV